MKRKVLLDSIFSIVATSIPIIVLQLVIYPVIGRHLGDMEYGKMITIISVISILSLPIGNVINNVRLINDKKYKENGQLGDYNIILLLGIVLNACFISIMSLVYFDSLNVGFTVILILTSTLMILKEYLIVSFRIDLNFKSILYNNIFLALGFAIGLGVFLYSKEWIAVYLCGYTLSFAFISTFSKLLYEPLKKTPYFEDTFGKSKILFISTAIKTLTTYADKILLFSLLGPISVSIYYSANIIGKMLGMIITPISSVLLSYLTKVDRVNISRIALYISWLSIGAAISYFILIAVSKPILQLLYPKWAIESFKLIYLTSGTAILNLVITVLNPFLLRFGNLKWQVRVNIINLLFYIPLAFIFYKYLGLLGFALGILLATIVKLIVFLWALAISFKQINKLS